MPVTTIKAHSTACKGYKQRTLTKRSKQAYGGPLVSGNDDPRATLQHLQHKPNIFRGFMWLGGLGIPDMSDSKGGALSFLLRLSGNVATFNQSWTACWYI